MGTSLEQMSEDLRAPAARLADRARVALDAFHREAAWRRRLWTLCGLTEQDDKP